MPIDAFAIDVLHSYHEARSRIQPLTQWLFIATASGKADAARYEAEMCPRSSTEAERYAVDLAARSRFGGAPTIKSNDRGGGEGADDRNTLAKILGVRESKAFRSS